MPRHRDSSRGATDQVPQFAGRDSYPIINRKQILKSISPDPTPFSLDDDLDKALSLALQNLALRPTSRAYQLAVTCAAAAEDLATTCQLLDEALELVYPTPALIATLQDTLSLCSE